MCNSYFFPLILLVGSPISPKLDSWHLHSFMPLDTTFLDSGRPPRAAPLLVKALRVQSPVTAGFTWVLLLPHRGDGPHSADSVGRRATLECPREPISHVWDLSGVSWRVWAQLTLSIEVDSPAWGLSVVPTEIPDTVFEVQLLQKTRRGSCQYFKVLAWKLT